MGDRRPKSKNRSNAESLEGSTLSDVFADLSLRPGDFKVESGRGKSFLSGQRIVWITVSHLPSGRQVSGKRNTTKKGAERETMNLLKSLLESL